jgi:hypothetical protein
MVTKDFEFDRIYVIESLREEDTKTGTELYEDLLRYHDGKDVLPTELYTVKSKNDFINVLETIKNKCKTESITPIIHLEIHGCEDGLELNPSQEFIRWEELYEHLSTINTLTGNNLFITLLVCCGAYLMKVIQPSKPSPFWGIVGSFDEIPGEDVLLRRYHHFYGELLSSFDIHKALDRLNETDLSSSPKYKVINSEQTFVKAFYGYIDKICSPDKIKERINKMIKSEKYLFSDENEKQMCELFLCEKIEKSSEEYYKKCCNIFFMLDKFPENKQRFKVCNTLKEFLEQWNDK